MEQTPHLHYGKLYWTLILHRVYHYRRCMLSWTPYQALWRSNQGKTHHCPLKLRCIPSWAKVISLYTQSYEGPACDVRRPQHTWLRCHSRSFSLKMPTIVRYNRHHLARRKLVGHTRRCCSQYSQKGASASASVSPFQACRNSGGYSVHLAEMEAALQHSSFSHAGICSSCCPGQLYLESCHNWIVSRMLNRNYCDEVLRDTFPPSRSLEAGTGVLRSPPYARGSGTAFFNQAHSMADGGPSRILKVPQ